MIIIKDIDIQKKIKRRRKRFRFFFMLVVISIMVIFLFKNPVLKVEGIVVKGNNVVEEQAIKELSNIKLGDNLLKINTRQISENILTNSYIEDVKIKRSLFGTVQIIVNERHSAGIAKFGDRFVTVDKKGVVIELIDSRDGISLPLIEGLDIKEAKPGNVFEPSEIRKIEVFKIVFDNITNSNLSGIISEVDMKSLLSIIIKTEYGINIKLGSIENIEYKLKVSKAIMEKDIQKKGLKGTIDISFNGNPVFKQD